MSLTSIPEKRWSVDLEDTNIRPVRIAINRGESWRLCAHITQGGLPFSGAGNPELYWQPADKDESFGWWHKAGEFNQYTGEISAEFTAEDDDGSDGYRFYLSFSVPSKERGGGRSYSAFGMLRLMYSPGATPNSLEPPIREIDFDKVVVKNSPFMNKAVGDLAEINTFSVEDASDFEIRRVLLDCVNNLNKIIRGNQ